MNVIIGLISNSLFWEVLHNCQGCLLVLLVFIFEVEVGVLLLILTLNHLDIAGHITILSGLLWEVLSNDQLSYILLVLSWSIWLRFVHGRIILKKIDNGCTGLIDLLLGEVLNDGQSCLLVFLIVQFLQSRLLGLGQVLHIGINLNGIIDEDEVLLLILLSSFLELDQGIWSWNGGLKHNEARSEQVR